MLKRLLNLNTLLVFSVVAIILRLTDGSDIAIFATSALAIIPLAGLIGTRPKRDASNWKLVGRWERSGRWQIDA